MLNHSDENILLICEFSHDQAGTTIKMAFYRGKTDGTVLSAGLAHTRKVCAFINNLLVTQLSYICLLAKQPVMCIMRLINIFLEIITLPKMKGISQHLCFQILFCSIYSSTLRYPVTSKTKLSLYLYVTLAAHLDIFIPEYFL